MKDKFYELTIKSDNCLEILKELIFLEDVTCIEEKDGGIILRDEESFNGLLKSLNEYIKIANEHYKTNLSFIYKVEQKDNIDWINSYKNSIKPVEVGEFYVRPSWEEAKENLINIIIDPALAFGSGHHESTNMCLELISKYAKSDKSALDVGCGSGILSIALAKLGLKVEACDTDELAIASSNDNAILNEVKLEKTWVGSVDGSKKYDFVVANIIADVILILQNDLKNSLNSGGILILSGILEKYLDRIKNSFKELEILEIKQKNDWVSLALTKK